MTQSRIRITHMGVAILLALSVGAPWAFSNEDCDICQEDYEEWVSCCLDEFDTDYCDEAYNDDQQARWQCYQDERDEFEGCVLAAQDEKELCEEDYCNDDTC